MCVFFFVFSFVFFFKITDNAIGRFDSAVDGFRLVRRKNEVFSAALPPQKAENNQNFLHAGL